MSGISRIPKVYYSLMTFILIPPKVRVLYKVIRGVGFICGEVTQVMGIAAPV